MSAEASQQNSTQLGARESVYGRSGRGRVDRKSEDVEEVEAEAEASPLTNSLPNPNKVVQITEVDSCQ